MNINDLFDFLRPQTNEPIQLVFFCLILFLVVLTIIMTQWFARPTSWERKWNGGTPDDHTDDLDVDHGSVTDIWNAVATGPEKIAEIMPGTLLVIGLLGTFLGLGLVLNDASHLLGHSSSLNANGIASSMQNLMGMLQGLGTKFKTSTWGIIGFLILKLWMSFSRFEEKRLSWSIKKVKFELESRKRIEKETKYHDQEILFKKFEWVACHIVDGYARKFDEYIGHDLRIHRSSMESLDSFNKTLLSVLDQSHERNALYFEKIFNFLNDGFKSIQNNLMEIHSATKRSSDSINQFSKDTGKIIKDMGVSAESMAQGASQVGQAASNLVIAVDEFKQSFTIALDSVRTNLGQAIDNMSAQASNTLKEGSHELGLATKGISTALSALSADVKGTMHQVEISIKDANNMQTKAHVAFITSSDTLNQNVNEMTNLSEKVRSSIEGGLSAVSESGRRMEYIGKSLADLIPHFGSTVSSLEELPKSLEPILMLPRQIQIFLEKLDHHDLKKSE